MYPEKQEKHIHIRVSAKDYQKIKSSAELYGLSVGQYSKKILQKSRQKKPKFSYAETQKIETELNHIGNNVNQLARSLNQLNKYLSYDPFSAESATNQIRNTQISVGELRKRVDQLWQLLN